jgi:hypothetical protein
MRKSIVKSKKKQVAKKAQKQTTKTQSQTQRQIVNVILPTRSQRVRQPKAQQPQSSQFQTFYIERAPSQQVISNDPFRTGIIQKSKEANVSSGGLTTNVAGLSKLLPEIAKDDFTKPQLTLSNISQTNIPETEFNNSYMLGTVDFTNEKIKRKAVTPGASLGRPQGSKNKPKIKETNQM